jgi:acetate---CoA ligase (ADP-forming)
MARRVTEWCSSRERSDVTVRKQRTKGTPFPPSKSVASADAPPLGFPDLSPFLHPASIAVVGASNRAGGDSHPAMWHKIRLWAEATGAKLYPVNPHVSTLDGHACLSSVAELPEGVDLGAIFVNADGAVELLRTLDAVGVKFGLMFASGFAESGRDGSERQRRLKEVLATTRLRLVGPNTNVNSFEIMESGLSSKKAVAVVTQSGGLGRAIVAARAVGFRCHRWIPTGNEADLEFADFITAFAQDGAVGAIAAYIEGVRSGERFLRAAEVARKRAVPIVVLKVGRSKEGQRAAQSHTGHLAGSDEVMSGVLRQAGVVRVDDLDQLIEVSNALANAQQPDRGQGAAIYGYSGGAIVLTADLLASAGVALPALAAQTQRELRQWIPGYLPVSNPVDSGWTATRDWRNKKILEAILSDPRVGLLVCPITGVYRDGTESFDNSLRDMVDVSRSLLKPIFVVWADPSTDDRAFKEILVPSELAVFRSVSNCARAAGALFSYHDHLRAHRVHSRVDGVDGRQGCKGSLSSFDTGESGDPLVLLEPEAKRLLAAYGFTVSTDIVCNRVDDAVEAARTFGFPVVMKVVHPAVVHRTAMHLIEGHIRSDAELRESWSALERRMSGLGLHWANEASSRTGILVSKQLSPRLELALGVARDLTFGAVIMLALGGTNIEIVRRAVFRTPAMQRADARDMVSELCAAPGLHSLVEKKVIDREAVSESILNLARLVTDYGPRLRELDVNPLAVTDGGLTVLDAYAVLSGES